MLKRLLIWMVLVCLPLQSYAAATMLYCEPAQHGATRMSHEGHMNGDMHQHHHDGAAKHSSSDDGSSSPQKSTGKCSACSACCLGTGLTAATVTTLLLTGSPVMVSRPIDALASVTLEGLQRPPRTTCV